MFKSCRLAVVLAVTVILSLEAAAQSTVDDAASCGSSTLHEAVREIKDEIRDKYEDVKKLFVTNSNEPLGREYLNLACYPSQDEKKLPGLAYYSSDITLTKLDALLPQRNRATRNVSRIPVNCGCTSV